MNRYGKTSVVKTLVVIFVFLTININLLSLIVLNAGEQAFEKPNPDGESANSVTIQSCIVDGAGYYMKAYSDILLFLKQIEWSDPANVDYDVLQTIVNRALNNMKYAEGVYADLEELAYTTPYNPVFIEKIMTFDYISFQQTRSAYGAAFIKTWKYLAAGNIRGLFAHIKAGSGQIVYMLKYIKASLDDGRFPELSSLWRLNQKAGEIMLTGQFAAEIFFETGGCEE